MKRILISALLFAFALIRSGLGVLAQAPFDVDDTALEMPQIGDNALHVLSPTILELVLINTKPPGAAPVDSWNFVDSTGLLQPPLPAQLAVTVNGYSVAIASVGFKRRALYAPLALRDLRLDSRLYLQLTAPISDGSAVSVTNPTGDLWTASTSFSVVVDPLRYSGAIHVNQEGYTTAFPKKAMIGFYLGSLGEMAIPAASGFTLVNVVDNSVVYSGALSLRPDVGFTLLPTPYQQVYQADFSSFCTPGEYELVVPGLGASMPFLIDDSLVMGAVRNYALGLYNQRCGTEIRLPFSRDVHPACHTAPAQVPTPQASFAATWGFIAASNGGSLADPQQTAPPLGSESAQLYPFARTGAIDVSGGHHDAGDYSKYTIDSAQLIHYLTFAADSFPGVGALDNLGIPESGDGKSDLLEEAKVEADFLVKMQDTDGGFYFLVYPRDRRYEDNVLPQDGDSQVVWPKNTSATAAAVAALAELSSSPLFRQQFPASAALYFQKAQAGWAFLTNAIAAHGKDGAYQMVTQYGDVFMHNDELAWAACEMFLATGNPSFQQQLIAWYNPDDPATLRWGWWRLFESYGCAARSYAFAVASGRMPPGQQDANYLAACTAQVIAAGDDALLRTQNCAYGSAFDAASKRQRTAGWYFSSERAFDLTAAYQLNANPDYIDAVFSNLNYELGCNPVNVVYVTGLGSKRQRQIVDQFAQNDQRVLPPSGIPLGNIQSGFPYLPLYGTDFDVTTFPSDGVDIAPYPFYDRWADTYNTMTEFTSVNQARSLASLAFFGAQTPAAAQSWQSAPATIALPANYAPANAPVTAELSAPGLDLSAARIVWEAAGQQPNLGGTAWTFTPATVGTQWVEAEAALPDGRRVVAAGSFSTVAGHGGIAFQTDSHTVALYHFDTSYRDSGPNHYNLIPSGHVTLASGNCGWMSHPTGQVARFSALGDTLTVSIPDARLMPNKKASALSVEAWIYPRAYKAYGVGNYPVVALEQAWDSSFQLVDGKWNAPEGPTVGIGETTLVSSAQWAAGASVGTWHFLRLTFAANGTAQCSVDGVVLSAMKGTDFNYGRTNAWTLTLGNFDGDIDEVRISKIVR